MILPPHHQAWLHAECAAVKLAQAAGHCAKCLAALNCFWLGRAIIVAGLLAAALAVFSLFDL